MPSSTAVEVADFVTALQGAGDRLARAAGRCELDAPLPTCPEWVMRDLLHHIGGVHRWATSFVTSGRLEPTSTEEDEGFFGPVPDDQLRARFDEGLAALVAALAAADPGLQCWTFLPAPSPLHFWARRQAHETSIHCADAEATAGWPSVFPVDVALDGIDELLHGFFGRSRGSLVADPPVTLGVRATDADRSWSIRIERDRRVVSDTVDQADCQIWATANDLYLLLWNRKSLDDVRVEGDSGVLDHWREYGRIRWS